MKIYKKKQHLLDTIDDFEWDSNRCILIDWFDYADIDKLLNCLKSRAGELKKSNKKQIMDEQLLAIQKIYATDISHIYRDEIEDSSREYYVYAHCDSSKNIIAGKGAKTTFTATLGMQHPPFYIGKGKGDRAYNIKRNGYHQKVNNKLSGFNKQVEVCILVERLTSNEALAIESKLIDIFDLQSRGGTLVNLDEGKKSRERRECYQNELCTISKYWREFLKM